MGGSPQRPDGRKLQASPRLVCGTIGASEGSSGSEEGSPASPFAGPRLQADLFTVLCARLSTHACLSTHAGPGASPCRRLTCAPRLARALPHSPPLPSPPAAAPSAGFWKVLRGLSQSSAIGGNILKTKGAAPLAEAAPIFSKAISQLAPRQGHVAGPRFCLGHGPGPLAAGSRTGVAERQEMAT